MLLKHFLKIFFGYYYIFFMVKVWEFRFDIWKPFSILIIFIMNFISTLCLFFFFFFFFSFCFFFFFFFQNSMLSFSSEVEFVFSLLLTMRFFIEHSFIVSESSILLVLVYLVIASIKLSSFWFNLLFNFFHYIYKTFLNKVILSL